VHRDGDWHAALHIWVGGVGAEGPFVLFQRRSLSKDTWPGALDVSVGGHLGAGETLVEAARESEEEIGLVTTLDALTYIGRRWASWEQHGVRDNELQHVYALRNDAPLSAYRLHPDEVDALVAVPIEAALRLFRGEVAEIPARVVTRAGALSSTTVTAAEFVPVRGRYKDLALTALSALLHGEDVAPFEERVEVTHP
jgi:isopentenyldiphosphate isomerase